MPEAPKPEETLKQELADTFGAQAIEVPRGPAVPATGKRPAFREIRRQITDEELANPGVQKLILDNLDQALDRCEALEVYVDRFHEADKLAAIYKERLRPQTANEILFAVMLTVGGVIIGLSPYLSGWHHAGRIGVGVGAVLIIGAIAARIMR